MVSKFIVKRRLNLFSGFRGHRADGLAATRRNGLQKVRKENLLFFKAAAHQSAS